MEGPKFLFVAELLDASLNMTVLWTHNPTMMMTLKGNPWDGLLDDPPGVQFEEVLMMGLAEAHNETPPKKEESDDESKCKDELKDEIKEEHEAP
eukprot:4421645-Karenia_brevis.AAC.1